MTKTLAPALSDEELRETLDLFSTVMASVSDRVDAQTDVLHRVNKTATEARQAAFAAQKQTAPELYADYAVQTIDIGLEKTMARLTRMADHLHGASTKTEDILRQAEQDRSEALRQIWERQHKVDRQKARLPWFGLGALVLAVGLSVMLPRFLVSNASTCSALGASWMITNSGIEACVFYRE